MTPPRPLLTRAELERPYLHPYRTWIPRAWQEEHVPRNVAAGGGAALAGLAAGVVTGQPFLLALGLTALLLALVHAAIVAGTTSLAVRTVARRWRSGHPLAAVRASRPHAGERDPELSHHEYAVSVEGSGHLRTWRLRPLIVGERPRLSETLVPGRPSYAAELIGERPFDHTDATRAAEQLLEAQAEAARWEADARDRAQRAELQAGEERERAEDIALTAAALRHLTGQTPER